MIKFKRANIILVSEFLKSAGNSIQTFRYFNKREISVIKSHLYNLILLNDNIITGYGHLEIENEKVWLGVCVIESEKGKGYGKKIIMKLLDFAKKNKIEEIFLTVDTFNFSAIKLYEKLNFKIEKRNSSNILMKLKMGN